MLLTESNCFISFNRVVADYIGPSIIGLSDVCEFVALVLGVRAVHPKAVPLSPLVWNSIICENFIFCGATTGSACLAPYKGNGLRAFWMDIPAIEHGSITLKNGRESIVNSGRSWQEFVSALRGNWDDDAMIIEITKEFLGVYND